MKKLLIGVLAMLFIVPGAALAADVIKIGINAPITGDIPKVGEGTKFAAQMWLEDVMAAGGLEVGGKKYPVELAIEDNESTNGTFINDEEVFDVTPLRSGDLVAGFYDLVVGYEPEAPLFIVDEFELRRGQCVALLGPNGSGKTTFLKTVLGQLAPLRGSARLGASLQIGYWAQTREELDPENDVIDEILRELDDP